MAVLGNVDNLYHLRLFWVFFLERRGLSAFFFMTLLVFPLTKQKEIGSDAIIIQTLQTVEEKTRYVLAFLILPRC